LCRNADERKERRLGIQFGSAPDAFPGTARREPEPAGPAEQTGADRLSGNAQDELDEPQEPAPREINPEPQARTRRQGVHEPDRNGKTPGSASPIKYIGFEETELAEIAPGLKIEIKIGNVRRKGILEARIPLKLISDSPEKLMVGLSADAETVSSGATGKNKPGDRMGGRSGGNKGGGPGGNMGGGPGGNMGGGPGGSMGGGPGGNMGGGPGGSMGGGPGGNMGTNNNYGSDSDNSAAFEMWVHVTLSGKQN
ncbi:MAG: hypothetical protein PHW69_10000, partial [Elusimicrobiaceae bacterium]|nr:hypothetical protein [Elusimicrobiaceae bacterium]